LKSSLDEIAVTQEAQEAQEARENRGVRKHSFREYFARFTAALQSTDKAQRRAGANIIKFMAVLLALTLIARGTSGATLARVEISGPSRSEIVTGVTGSATISARDTLDIVVPPGLTIVEMLIGAGQTVNIGDAVAVFDIDEVLLKLARENASLARMQLDLDRLEREEDTDASSLESARRNRDRAREDYATTRAQGDSDIAAARLALEETLTRMSDDPDVAALESAMRNLTRVQEDYEAVRAQGDADVAAAREALNEALDATPEPVDSTALDNAERTLRRAREDSSLARVQGDTDVGVAWSAFVAAQNNENTRYNEWVNAAAGDKPAAWQAYISAQNETSRAQDSYSSVQRRVDDSLFSAARRVEDAEVALARAQSDYDRSARQAADAIQNDIDRARDALDSTQRRADDNLQSATRRLEDAEVSLAQAQQNYDRSMRQASDSRRTEISRAQDSLAETQRRAQDNLRSAERRVEDAENSLAQAELNYERSIQQSDDSTIQNSVSAISARLDIDNQKAVVDALNVLVVNNGILYSDISGVVSGAGAVGSTTGQNALVSFMDGAKGFEARMQLDRTRADQLTVGDECKVTTGGGSMYYNPTVDGLISAISPPDEQDRVQVTVRLPEGSWTAGQRVDVQAIQDRSIYDMCVPLSALRSDNTGYFIFLIERKSTVLGIENVVTRMPVTVIASDDDMAAVQGSLGRDSQIVTGSNKAVSTGDRVRIMENA